MCRNRYIVECKVATRLFVSTACMVEIDTLWNVKTINRRENRMAGTVEIDTLWNVK